MVSVTYIQSNKSTSLSSFVSGMPLGTALFRVSVDRSLQHPLVIKGSLLNKFMPGNIITSCKFLVYLVVVSLLGYCSGKMYQLKPKENINCFGCSTLISFEAIQGICYGCTLNSYCCLIIQVNIEY